MRDMYEKRFYWTDDFESIVCHSCGNSVELCGSTAGGIGILMSISTAGIELFVYFQSKGD